MASIRFMNNPSGDDMILELRAVLAVTMVYRYINGSNGCHFVQFSIISLSVSRFKRSSYACDNQHLQVTLPRKIITIQLGHCGNQGEKYIAPFSSDEIDKIR